MWENDADDDDDSPIICSESNLFSTANIIVKADERLTIAIGGKSRKHKSVLIKNQWKHFHFFE